MPRPHGLPVQDPRGQLVEASHVRARLLLVGGDIDRWYRQAPGRLRGVVVAQPLERLGAQVGSSALFGLALAATTIAALGAMLIGSRLAEGIAGLVGLDEAAVFLWTWLRLPVALFLLAMVLSVVYRFAPNTDQPYHLVTPGAAVAVGAWIVASVGFSVYLGNFADYGATYGSLGAAIGLLLYLYISAFVVLLGAEVNAAIQNRPGKRDPSH